MDTVTLVGRLLVSLAAVLVLMWFIGRRLRKGGRFKDTKLIDVLARQQLSRNSSLAVVRIGEQALVIGVTDAQVNVLGETDLGTAQAMIASAGQAKPTARRAAHSARPVSVPRTPARAAAQARVRTVADLADPADLADIADLAGATDRTDERGEAAPRRSPISGSALSPQTWRQTIESLRDLTSRSA